MDEFSVGEPLAEAFDESGIARFGRVIELFVAVVRFAGCEQAGAAPCLDRVVVDAELPQEDEQHPEVDRASLSPAELFRAYFRKENGGAEPADNLLEMFKELHHQAEGGEE